MCHENQLVVPRANRFQFLFNLRHMLMRERLVSVERCRALRMMSVRRGFSTGTRRAGLRINNDAATQQIIRNQRRQTEQRRCRKTSGVCNAGRRLDCLAIRLSETVNKLRLSSHRRLRTAVVLSENFRVAQTKIAREVNHFHMRRKFWCNLHCLPVRQREKRAVKFVDTPRSEEHTSELQSHSFISY